MASEMVKHLTIAVIPGTGSMGGLIVEKMGKAGLRVFLGSRDAEKGKAAAVEASKFTVLPVKGVTNAEAAAAGDVIFWTPSGSIADREAMLKPLAKHLEGKVIIDVTNVLYMLDETKWGQVSSTLMNEKALGVPARWTTAFKNTFSQLLRNPPDVNNPHSILVSGDDEEAVAITMALVDLIPGFKGVNAGPLKYSKIVELLGPRWIMVLDKLNSGQSFRTGYRIG